MEIQSERITPRQHANYQLAARLTLPFIIGGGIAGIGILIAALVFFGIGLLIHIAWVPGAHYTALILVAKSIPIVVPVTSLFFLVRCIRCGDIRTRHNVAQNHAAGLKIGGKNITERRYIHPLTGGDFDVVDFSKIFPIWGAALSQTITKQLYDGWHPEDVDFESEDEFIRDKDGNPLEIQGTYTVIFADMLTALAVEDQWGVKRFLQDRMVPAISEITPLYTFSELSARNGDLDMVYNYCSSVLEATDDHSELHLHPDKHPDEDGVAIFNDLGAIFRRYKIKGVRDIVGTISKAISDKNGGLIKTEEVKQIMQALATLKDGDTYLVNNIEKVAKLIANVSSDEIIQTLDLNVQGYENLPEGVRNALENPQIAQAFIAALSGNTATPRSGRRGRTR